MDDYTFTVTTDRPTPYLVKLFADLWVVPQHVVKDRDTMAPGPPTQRPPVLAGPYKMEKWEKGKEIVLTANDKYTGPYPPHAEKIDVIIMDPNVRFNAYKNGELDVIGHLFDSRLDALGHGRDDSRPRVEEAAHLLAQLHHLLHVLRHLERALR